MQRIATFVAAILLVFEAHGFQSVCLAAPQPTKIVILAGNDSHGRGAHAWGDGSRLLAHALNEESGLPVKAEVHLRWPKDPASAFKNAGTVVVLCDGGGRHVLLPHLKAFKELAGRGVGLVNVHYAVEVPKGQAGDAFLEWVGGYFETHWSVNPHWTAEVKLLPDHPIANGVKPFTLNDEWYYHMRFRQQMKGVTPILSALPPVDTLKRKDGPHSGNPYVREAVLKRKEAQHVAWAYDRTANGGKGRGFGITGAHYHKSWDNDSFRTTVLNAIVWTAGLDVPSGGVKSLPNPTKRLAEAHGQKSVGVKKGAPKGVPMKDAAFASKVVTAGTPGHSVKIEANIKGAKQLYLVVTDAGDGYSCDWADWAEPRLVTADDKETKLTDLKWKSAQSGFGTVKVNGNARGAKMLINNQPVAYGIGTHANSVIIYDLPKGHQFVKFLATGGLDNGGTSQGCGSTVQFAVFTKKPASAIFAAAPRRGGGGGGNLDPEASLQALDVHEDLQAELFANEPMLLSPSNVDIDHLGRAWVCEIVNYRRHRNARAEGDRILILEDTNDDGVADKKTTFYQGRDIDSPHGVCVLATPDFKNTKVIVSAGETVFLFTDKDGDGKADDKKILFQKISGAQHDHGIHAFVFGPDGKLYFNFGNAGKQLHDAEGKIVVDKAGNEVRVNRKPYQQGLVFRCDLDGSNVETLGWNFRNNWMATVDSFGTIWQSDNDDDGNRGVRINYVMEFGNYGYKDEMTGAGWKTNRTGMNPQLPWKHWYQNDPGVVPNLLHTGAGSPTGITVYEGDLLPKVFQGQMIHTDAGPNVCRAYPVTKDGAGYKAEMVNVLTGARDRWYRPADVAIAPDGSLIIADWYDPGVGGHNMRDLERGRLFRVTPKGHKGYKVPKYDFATAEGAAEALKSPNYAARYVAWQALDQMKGANGAKEALTKLASDSNPRYRARALWLLARLPRHANQIVNVAAGDKSDDIRGMAIRIARQHEEVNTLGVVEKLANDKSALVRRECAIALRFDKSSEADSVWAKLAAQHDGQDRWYLEALGLASDLNADARFAAYLKAVGGPDKALQSAGGRDIIWRVRAKAALPLLAKLIGDDSMPKAQKDRYVRALDFHPKGPEKDKAMQAILGL